MKPCTRLFHIILFIQVWLSAFVTSRAADSPMYISLPDVGTLSTSTVHAIYPDTKGYLWIGTDKEVVVFDGNNALYTVLCDANNKILKIFAITELKDGTMLIGTGDGVYTVDFAGEGTPRSKAIAGSANEVTAIVQIPDGSILIGENQGLKVASPDLGEYRDTGISDMAIRDIVATDKNAYIGTARGVYTYDYATGNIDKITKEPLDVSAMVRDRDNLYVATRRDGISLLNLKTGDINKILSEGPVITDLAKDSSANIYVATDGDGLLKYDSTLKRFIPYGNTRMYADKQLRNNQVYSLAIDNADRMYIGFYMAGVEYAPSTQDIFSGYSGDADSEMSVRALYADDTHLLVGTRDGAYYIEKSSGNRQKLSRDKLGSRLVLAVDKVGSKYYLGTYGGGLSVFDPSAGSISRISGASGLTTGDAFSIDNDKTNDIVWVATSTGLYGITGDKVVKHIDRLDNGQSLGYVYEVYTDSKGVLWVCTRQAIYNLDTSGHLVENKEIRAEDVRQVMETRSHRYWFVTNAGALEIYDSDFKPEALTAKLRNITDARGVAEDAAGNVWITSDNGIFRYSPRFDFLTQYLNIHGLKSPIFNTGKPVVDADGTIYFCYSKGMLTADTHKVTDAGTSRLKAVPTIVSDSHGKRLLSDIRPDENGYYTVPLLSPQKMVKLYFSDFAYVGNDLSRYEYSIDSGRTWTKLPGDMEVTFTNIDNKDLDIRVRQLGNPHTETKLRVINGTTAGDDTIWVWSMILAAIIVIICVIAVVVTLARKKSNDKEQPESVPDKPKVKAHASSDEYLKEDGQKSESDVRAYAEVPHPIPPKEEERVKTQADAEPLPEEKASVDAGEEVVYNPADASKKYSTFSLTDSECEEISDKLKKWLETSKAYTNPNLKISEVASAIHVSPHKLSYVFSQYLNTNYYDYLYKYRVDEFKRLAYADTKHTYTLIALSEKAGFNSKATFFRAFKKQEGVTPGDFMKSLRIS